MNEGPKSHLLLLLDRVQGGDEAAARELVEKYGPIVQREIRFRLRDSRFYRAVGESPLFQSAITRFFWGLRLGKFDARTPEELVCLLRKIAERRMFDVERLGEGQRTDVRRAHESSAIDEATSLAQPIPRSPNAESARPQYERSLATVAAELGVEESV